MSLLNNYAHYHFYSTKELNRFYVSVFFMKFGEALISIFVPIYLFGLGYDIFSILLFFFWRCFYFVILSIFGAQVVSKVGDKHAILISIPFLLIYYFGLNLLPESPWLFNVLPLILSFRLVLYNYGYHLNYINHSDKYKRGKEIANFALLSLFATIMAPFLGSVLAGFNFTVVFTVSSILVALGAVPLLLSPDCHEKMDFDYKSVFRQIFSKGFLGNSISFSAYAIESIIGLVLWPIFLILMIGNLQTTGTLISISMAISFLSFYFIGKLTDKVDKRKLLKIGTILYFFAWFGRVFATDVYRVLFVDSYRNLSEKVLHLPWTAQTYELAVKSNYFEFIVVREIIFNLSRVLLFPILFLIFWIDFHPFLTSFLLASFSSLGYFFIDKK